MATLSMEQELQVQTWEQDSEHQFIERSVWSQLSNRMHQSDPIPNVYGMDEVPDAVILDVSDKFTQGNWKTTLPWVGKIAAKMLYGRARAKGNERNLEMKFRDIYYNNQRQTVNTGERTVDGREADFYKYGKEAVAALTDNRVEQMDFDLQRTIIEGSPEHLTLSTAWTGPSHASAAMSRKFHPNFYANGASSAVTYSTTLNTHEGNIQTAADALTTSQNAFDLDAVESIAELAHETIIPLGWRTKGELINYVCLISPYQARDLRRDSEWKELFAAADVRGDLNRAISGVFGVYRNVLWIVDERSPIWNTGGSANAYVCYKTPACTKAIPFQNAAEATISRSGKTAASSGTVEMARLLGKRAIGRTMPLKNRLVRDSDDYDFFHGAACDWAWGAARLDYDIHTPTSTSYVNDSSFVYMTATPDVVF